MYLCPNCSQKTFRFAAKLWSCEVLPAKCRECGELCFAPGSPADVLLVLNIVLLTAAGVLASWLHSVLPLLAGAGLAIAAWFFRLHHQPLLALSREQIAQARKREGFWLIVCVLLSTLQ